MAIDEVRMALLITLSILLVVLLFRRLRQRTMMRERPHLRMPN
jgi:hypothetical protein